ncbi:hypothetical protein L484_007322 [Morus notabilis]|uniref:Uncharacterized protein n=1 Tax=Morus notabilis TaxID=981085 RepID=W9RQ19_9ROSA|nr:hypothetical protein L484_007322 [Morus notabilis]
MMPHDHESSQRRSTTDGLMMTKSIELVFSNLRRFRHHQLLHRRSYHLSSTSTAPSFVTKIVPMRERLDLQRREASSQVAWRVRERSMEEISERDERTGGEREQGREKVVGGKGVQERESDRERPEREKTKTRERKREDSM